MSTSQTVKRSLSVHTVVLDEIDPDGDAAHLIRTLRCVPRADLQRSAARDRQNRPHGSTADEHPRNLANRGYVGIAYCVLRRLDRRHTSTYFASCDLRKSALFILENI